MSQYPHFSCLLFLLNYRLNRLKRQINLTFYSRILSLEQKESLSISMKILIDHDFSSEIGVVKLLFQGLWQGLLKCLPINIFQSRSCVFRWIPFQCEVYMTNPSIDIKSMKTSLILLAILILTQAQTADKPLKALLYCYLPAVNTSNTTEEYTRLASQINQHLRKKNINVVVEVCNETTAAKLYDASEINSLFDDYDIVELDVSYLWAVTTDLLSFTKNEISFYDSVFPFEWVPLARSVDGTDSLIGSPGLLCSTFIETREDDNYQHRLYAKLNSNSAYGLVDLYLNTFINLEPDRTLESVDYSKVDDQTISSMADFLKDCQEDDSAFDYSNNWCLKKLAKPFFKTNYSKTTGYSQNLFNFQNQGIDSGYIQIEHITQGKEKKVFYLDSFVAKKASDKNTTLSFYEFMISDKILDIYVKGEYTNAPGTTTYLLPPTRSYLKRMAHRDYLYESIAQTAFKGIQLPLYQKAFAENVFSFATLIDNALKALPADNSDAKSDTSSTSTQNSETHSAQDYVQ